MSQSKEKEPRMMRLTKTTHELFRSICKEEEMTAEGLLKNMMAQWIYKKSKEA